MEEIFSNLLSSIVEEEVTEKVVEVVSDSAVPTASVIEVEDIALGLFDLALSTGFAEAAIILGGGPVALVMGVKMLKKWRMKQKGEK